MQRERYIYIYIYLSLSLYICIERFAYLRVCIHIYIYIHTFIHTYISNYRPEPCSLTPLTPNPTPTPNRLNPNKPYTLHYNPKLLIPKP